MSGLDIVIVHYHAAAAAGRAIESLRIDSARSGMPLHIIVVDNGSTDEERDFLRSRGVTYLNSGRNAGYAGALKIAFPHTRSDAIVLMNEDVLVLPGCLPTLNSTLMDGAAIVGPEFFWDLDCKFRLPCTEERTRRSELARVTATRSAAHLQRARQAWREHARRHWCSSEPMKTTSLSGAMLAFRRDTWTKIGPLDDRFLLYFEENDWLLRAASHGLKTLLVPAAKAIHLHNPSTAATPRRQQMYAQSFALFGRRHYGEKFMQRLDRLAKSPCISEHWPSDMRRVMRWPLWIEVTPSPLGFPAAAMRTEEGDVACLELPRIRCVELPESMNVLLVDDAGNELWHGRSEAKIALQSAS